MHLSIDVSRYRAVENARIWAALLGATLFTPALDGIVEVADGIATSSNNHNHKSNGDGHELRSSKIEVQLSDNFRRDVSALMGPNHSAIFHAAAECDSGSGARTTAQLWRHDHPYLAWR